MARPERVELPTFWFVARRSIQLSYGRAARKSLSQQREGRRPSFWFPPQADSIQLSYGRAATKSLAYERETRRTAYLICARSSPFGFFSV